MPGRPTAASTSRPTAARPGTRCCSATRARGAVDLVFDPGNPDVLYASLVGGVADAALAVERRTRQRPLQVVRRRRHVDRDLAACRAAHGPAGQDRRVGVGRRRQSRLRDHRSRRRRALLDRRWRAELDAGERGPQHPAARLLLHARLRRSRRRATPSTCSTCSSTSRPTAAARSRRFASRTATTTTCGSRPTIRSAWCRPTTAAPTSRSTAASRGRGSSTRRRSSTTRSRPATRRT